MTLSRTIYFVIAVLVPILGSAQTKTNVVEFNVGIKYNKGIGNINLNDYKLANRGYLVGIEGGVGVYVSHFQLGLEVGLSGFHSPDYNFLPVNFVGLYYLKERLNSLFIEARTGYALKIGDTFVSGFVGRLGVGYPIAKIGKQKFILCAGLDLNRVENGKTYIVDLQNGTGEFVYSSFSIYSFSVGGTLVF